MAAISVPAIFRSAAGVGQPSITSRRAQRLGSIAGRGNWEIIGVRNRAGARRRPGHMAVEAPTRIPLRGQRVIDYPRRVLGAAYKR